MLSGEPQNQVQSGSELLPNCAEILVKTVTSSSGSSSASSAVGGSDNHTRERPSPTLLVQARNDTISTSGHDSRPPLGSRELSMDMVDEIRKLIRQEFFGAYPSKDLSREPASEDGSLSPRSTNTILNGPEKKFPYPDTVVKLHQDDRDDGSCSSTMVSEPLPTPISAPSSSSSISSPSLSLVPLAATRADPPKPAVRFSDDVPSVRSPLSGPASPPAKKAPWAMYRRTSNGEPVPEWGVLFDENGFVTARCMQVFRGLARFLAEDSPPRGAVVVTPEKLGLLYSRFKIEGEMYPFEGQLWFYFFSAPRMSSTHSHARRTALILPAASVITVSQ
ncbi:hypothetical protein GGS21DRAFT_290876 [Xylaria nigripes]|nr:hypothetical protein GGS21DRAFT_290876 [Xylaria nigripes]